MKPISCYGTSAVVASAPGLPEEGPGNMKYKAPPMPAIFFMTSFNRDGGGMVLMASPWICSCVAVACRAILCKRTLRASVFDQVDFRKTSIVNPS